MKYTPVKVKWGKCLGTHTGSLFDHFGHRLHDVHGFLPADNSWEVSNSNVDQEEEDRMSAEESEYYTKHSDHVSNS